MPIYLPRRDEPLVDLKTGQVSPGWYRFFDALRELETTIDALTFADIGGQISLAQLVAHQATHQQGGGDDLKLDDCAIPDDNTDRNADTNRHGLLPRLTGNNAHTLRGDGTWA